MAAKYSNWRPAITRREFCLFSDFIKFVRYYQHIGFHWDTNRKCLVSAYEDLRCGRRTPFSETERFPEDKVYLDLDNEAIRSNIDKILSACDLPDRVDESSRLVQDAKRSFDVAFFNLRKIIHDSDEQNLLKHGVYSRESFEAFYGLVWE